MKFLLPLLAILPATLAHFQLNYPVSLGFDDDNEGMGPCGGVPIPSPLATNANSTNATVDSFAVALRTGHAQSNWLYRATISTVAPYNWTNILPIVRQTSVGQFCLPNLKVPSSFAGRVGMIQVIGDAPDGYLYQCAVVNFVTGANTTVGASCTNATGLTATVTTQSNFTTNSTANGTSTTSATPSASSSRSAAVAVLENSGFLGAALGVVGAVFML